MSDQTLFPTLKYADADAAMGFLREAFGFAEVACFRDDDGRVAHAELALDGAVLMIGTKGVGAFEPTGSAGLYVAVDDPDALHDRARGAGAEIVMELTDQDYGSREFAARDPEGNLWSFGTYRPKVT